MDPARRPASFRTLYPTDAIFETALRNYGSLWSVREEAEYKKETQKINKVKRATRYIQRRTEAYSLNCQRYARNDGPGNDLFDANDVVERNFETTIRDMMPDNVRLRYWYGMQ